MVVDDFFAKWGAFNLINKPMQVYNIDETGISVVHKPGKVFSAESMCTPSLVAKKGKHIQL